MSEQTDVLGAFKASVDNERIRVGGNESPANLNDVQVSATYADAGGIIPGVFSAADVAQQPILPGQRIMGKGTTVANPLRSDPRVEAVLGEKRYREKAPESSPNQMKIEVERLKNMVEMLLMQKGDDAMASTVEKPPAPQYDDDFEDKTMQELKGIAKSVGVKCPIGLSKDEIISRLRKFKYAG